MLNMSSHPPDPPIASQSISPDSPDRGLRSHIVETLRRKKMARLFHSPGADCEHPATDSLFLTPGLWRRRNVTNRGDIVVERGRGEQETIEPIEHAAMTRQQPPGIFHADTAFDGRFHQVSPQAGERQEHGEYKTIPMGEVRHKPPSCNKGDQHCSQ